MTEQETKAAAEPPLDCRVRTMTAIEKMAAVLSEYTGTCPNDIFMEIAGISVLDSTWEPCGGCENCCGAPGRSMDGNMSLCWQEWAEGSNA